MNRTERRIVKRSDLKTLKTKKVVFDQHKQIIKHRQRKYNEKSFLFTLIVSVILILLFTFWL
jgi:hypothetical protein